MHDVALREAKAQLTDQQFRADGLDVKVSNLNETARQSFAQHEAEIQQISQNASLAIQRSMDDVNALKAKLVDASASVADLIDRQRKTELTAGYAAAQLTQLSQQLDNAKSRLEVVQHQNSEQSIALQQTQQILSSLLPRELTDQMRVNVANVFRANPNLRCVVRSEPGVADAPALFHEISSAVVNAGGVQCQWDPQFQSNRPINRIVVQSGDVQSAQAIANALYPLDGDTRYSDGGAVDSVTIFLGARAGS